MATDIQERLKHQNVSKLRREICPDCNGHSAELGYWCDRCFGLPFVYSPIPDNESKWHWLGIAVLLGLLAAYWILR